jgi:hypothetical protein
MVIKECVQILVFDSMKVITKLYFKKLSKNHFHSEWIKNHNIKRENINFDKSYVLIRRDRNNKFINPHNYITWILVPYKEFFTCNCPNLKGDGSNHSLENCHHYQRSQFKKLQSGQILHTFERNYLKKYHNLKQKYKPIDYDIFLYIKNPMNKKWYVLVSIKLISRFYKTNQTFFNPDSIQILRRNYNYNGGYYC